MSEPTYEWPVNELPEEHTEYVSRRGRRMLTALIIVLIIILLLAVALLLQLLMPSVDPSEERGGVTWVRSIYGYGPDVSQMIEPASVAVDPTGGELWVTDQVRFRLVKFNGSTGDYVDMFEGDAEVGDLITYPSHVAVAPDGWMFVAESTYDTVRVYDDMGAHQQTIDIPSPLSIAANNEMFIIGAQAGFAAYTRDGELIGIVGTRGQDEGQFDGVNGVVLDDDNNAYVVDSFNNRITKFDPEGFPEWMTRTGPPGNQAFGSRMDSDELQELADEYPALMQVPMGATLDAAGRLIVIDLLDFTVAAFDAEDGTFLDKWGAYGQADGMFAYPADIEYDAAYDWFVVADSGNRRAQIIRLPDSGGGAEETMRRLLSGPLRACGFPLLALLVMLTAWVLYNRRNAGNDPLALEEDVAEL